MTSVERVPNLDALARTIKAEIAAAEADWQSAVRHALNAGDALIAAKAACGGHGKWLPFLAEIGLPARTAQNYMRLSRNALDVAHLPTVGAAIAALTEPRAEPEPEPEELTPDEVDDVLSRRGWLPELQPTESEATYAASAEDLNELYKNLSHDGALRQFILLYPEAQAAEIEAAVKRLKAEWGVTGMRDVVAEALRLVVDQVNEKAPPD